MPGTASRPRRQSAKAPTPGSTTRSALATTPGSCAHHDRLDPFRPRAPRARRPSRPMQIAGAVIDDGDAHRWLPARETARSRRTVRDAAAAACGGRGAVLRPGGARCAGLLPQPRQRRSAVRHLRVFAADDADIAPAAARQRQAPQRRRLRARPEARSRRRRSQSQRPTRRARAAPVRAPIETIR